MITKHDWDQLRFSKCVFKCAENLKYMWSIVSVISQSSRDEVKALD